MSDAVVENPDAGALGLATEADPPADLEAARMEIARLNSEYEDLKILYEATIEHGEAVEDQLAEANILLQQTQARLAEELQDASRYIMSIVPARRLEEYPKTDWQLVSSTELGGDSFGYHDIDDDHFAIYLLDVCGHGVGAALLSASVINVLRAAALPQADFRDPPAVLSALNDAFPMERQNDMFFTIWYGVYRRSSRRLRFSAAGHPPAIHLRNASDGPASVRLLGGEGAMAIGAFAGVEYDSDTITIKPGDRLLVLSDGTYEVDNGDRMLSLDELVEFVRQKKKDKPAKILDWVRGFRGPGSLPDDFSLLRVEF